jgi:hypothetical protein
MMDRTALLTAQAALLAVRETVVIRHGTTVAFDHALASIGEACQQARSNAVATLIAGDADAADIDKAIAMHLGNGHRVSSIRRLKASLGSGL